MTTHRPIWIVLATVAIAGCLAPTTTTPTPVGDIQAGSVKFIGEMGDNGTHFVMQGELNGCWDYRMGPSDCSNVTVELYSENGTHLRTFRVGNLNGSKHISIVASVVPHYVLIRSADFWGHPFSDVSYYERFEADHYTVHSIGERDEFPDVINVTGRG